MKEIFLDLANQSEKGNENAAENKTKKKPMVATIGFFDGVHRGHRFLIENIISIAKKSGLESAVITFDRHPREVLQADFRPQMLSTTEEKLKMLAETGIDRVVVLRFNREMAALSAREFMQNVLRDRLNVEQLIMGYDNRFGHNRSDSFEDYASYGKSIGIKVERADVFSCEGQNISSSLIRQLLLAGRIEKANRSLGYDYSFAGTVVKGFGNGRRLGFPTANIAPADKQKLIPGAGVYAVQVSLRGSENTLRGMMNIGTRPTFNGTDTSIEVNIFNFTADIYGQNIRIKILAHIRPERPFPSIEALARQLAADKQTIIELLNTHSS